MPWAVSPGRGGVRGCSRRNSSRSNPRRAPYVTAARRPHRDLTLSPPVLQGLGRCPSPGPGPEGAPPRPTPSAQWPQGPLPTGRPGWGRPGGWAERGGGLQPVTGPELRDVMAGAGGGGGRAVFVESWSWREGDKARPAAAPWSCGPASCSGNFCFCRVSAGCGAQEAPATSASQRVCGFRQSRPSELQPSEGAARWEGTVRATSEVTRPRTQEGVSLPMSSPARNLEPEAKEAKEGGGGGGARRQRPGSLRQGAQACAPCGQEGRPLGTVGLAGSVPWLPAPPHPPARRAGLLTRHIPPSWRPAAALEQELGCEAADVGSLLTSSVLVLQT